MDINQVEDSHVVSIPFACILRCAARKAGLVVIDYFTPNDSSRAAA